MQPNKTVVYYTSNQDYPALEEYVRQVIRTHADSLPIISVSQQPVELGDNICVGEIGRSLTNIYRQLRLGVERSRTRFIVVCESDFLYPKNWFLFQPERGDTYYYPHKSYIAYHNRQWYFPKIIHQLTGVIDRIHLLGLLDVLQSSGPEHRPSRVIHKWTRTEEFDAGHVVTVKTDKQMHDRSPHRKEGKQTELPEWGPWESFVKKHFGVCAWMS